MERKPCTKCKGTGERISKAFVSVEGEQYPERIYKCAFCDGSGYFWPINPEEILSAIVNKRTKKLRSTKPTIGGDRAYYVWRLARFNGGVDVCLPITAEMLVDGDPFKDELYMMSEAVARQAFGTTMGAANAWSRVL